MKIRHSMIKSSVLYQVSLVCAIFLCSTGSYVFGKKLNTKTSNLPGLTVQAPTAPILFKEEWKLPEMMRGSVVFTVKGKNKVVVALSQSMQDTGDMQTEKIVFTPKQDSTTYWISVDKGQDTQGKAGLAGSYVWRWVVKWGKGNVVGKKELGKKILETGGAPYMFRYIGFGCGKGVGTLSKITISDIKN